QCLAHESRRFVPARILIRAEPDSVGIRRARSDPGPSFFGRKPWRFAVLSPCFLTIPDAEPLRTFAGIALGVIGHFAVRGDVEAGALGFRGRTQADGEVH